MVHLLLMSASEGPASAGTPPPEMPAELEGLLVTRTAAQGGRLSVYRNSGYTSRTWRSRHIAALPCRQVRLAYGNISSTTYHSPPYSANANAITISAAVEKVGELHPVTFGGEPTTEVAPGAVVISDPIDVWYDTDEAFFVRSHHAAAPGGYLPGSSGFSLQASRGEGWGAGDLTAFGTVTAQNAEHPFVPIAIIGDVPEDTTVRSFAFFGNSIGEGVTDDLHGFPSTGGFLERMALLSGVPFSNFAASGERFEALFANWSARLGDTVAATFTDAVIEYGINDVLVYSAATLAEGFLRRWLDLRNKGFERVWHTTTTPRAADATNTAPQARESERATLVAWLRDGAPGYVHANGFWYARTVGDVQADTRRVGQAPHPLTGVIDVEAEAIAPGSLWKAGYSTDGLHPSPLGHEQIAAALAPLPA